MATVNSILEKLKQKTQATHKDIQSFDYTFGSDNEHPAMLYAGFMDILIARVKKLRPDVKEFFSKWGKIQLVPFYHFYTEDGQYKVGTSDMALLGEKVHINILFPNYVLSGEAQDSSYNKILHLSKLKDLKIEINVGQGESKRAYVVTFSYKNAIDLANMIVEQFIEPNFPYPNNVFFKPIDFYSFVNEYVYKTFNSHVIKMDSNSWQFNAYPTAKLIQKVLTIDFIGGGDITSNRLITHQNLIEFEPVLVNPRSRILRTKSSSIQKITYTPSSIIRIIQIIKDEFLDQSPILDHSADLLYVENLIISKINVEEYKASAIDAIIRNRVDKCLFFNVNEM
jgi:hypothetical protein